MYTLTFIFPYMEMYKYNIALTIHELKPMATISVVPLAVYCGLFINQ